MMFSAVTPDEMHAAQILTGATMAMWMVVGLIPAARPYVTRIRVTLLVAYLIGIAGFVAYFVVLR